MLIEFLWLIIGFMTVALFVSFWFLYRARLTLQMISHSRSVIHRSGKEIFDFCLREKQKNNTEYWDWLIGRSLEISDALRETGKELQRWKIKRLALSIRDLPDNKASTPTPSEEVVCLTPMEASAEVTKKTSVPPKSKAQSTPSKKSSMKVSTPESSVQNPTKITADRYKVPGSPLFQ